MPQPEDAIIACRVQAERVRPDGHDVTVAPDAAVLARLAARLDLPAIPALEARYRLTRRGRRVRVEGRLAARVVQTCVVTLEAFEADIHEPVDVTFEEAPRHGTGRLEPGRIEVEVALDAEDPPEPVEDGRIDLGRLTEEFLALALDPHPRKPGVAFADPEHKPETKRESPFAALAGRVKDRN